MANTTIQIKKSATPAATPSSLANGELAINYADGKLFYKAANGTIVAFSTSDGNNFGTVNANGTLLVSDTTGDVFTMVPGNNITIVGDAVNDKLTIGLTNDVTLPGVLYMNAIGGDEGGQIELGNAVTNSTLSGNVVIDIYQNKLRFYEKNSPNKGAFIDLGIAGSGVSTNLFSTSGGTTDTTARATAEAAFNKANSVQTIAVAAFDKANTGGGGGGGASVAISDVAPSSPTANSLWWSSDLGKMFIYYNDGSSNQWVETSPSPDVSGVTTAVTISGLAYNAANLAYATASAIIIPITPDTTGSADQYITFTGNTSGNLSGANIDYGLKFNPTGNVLNVSGVVRDSKGDVRDIPIYSVVVGYALGLSDTGETVSTNTTIYVPNATFGAGNTVSVYNNSSSSITITQNSGVTMYLGGTSTTGNRTLAQRGLATIYCVAANTFVIGGLGIS
jgi:hypothetical protein